MIDEVLKYAPLINIAGLFLYYFVIRRIDTISTNITTIATNVATVAATLAGHAADDLHRFEAVTARLDEQRESIVALTPRRRLSR
jgi:hypothetical protein